MLIDYNIFSHSINEFEINLTSHHWFRDTLDDKIVFRLELPRPDSVLLLLLLLTLSNLLRIGAGRFYDPRTRQSFKYDHLRKEASDYQPYESDATAESWRAALDSEIMTYTNEHYRHGVSSVFGRSQGNQITLTVCIEDHQFQPNNFWNGRWRSQWHVTFQPGSGSAATDLKGVLKVQVKNIS